MFSANGARLFSAVARTVPVAWLPFLAAGGPLGTALSFRKFASLTNENLLDGSEAWTDPQANSTE